LSKDLLLAFGVVISRHAPRAWRLCQLQFKRKLDLKLTFYLYRNVPEVDSGALQRAIGQTTQDGAVAFATTHWSVVLTAQGESSAAQEALEKLCRTYWRPIYGFVRRQGTEAEESKDLTQGFFALLLELRPILMETG
jgi:hypothetical protein